MKGIITKYINVIEPYREELNKAVVDKEVLHLFVFKQPYNWYLNFDRESTKHNLKTPLKLDLLKNGIKEINSS